MDPDIIMHTVPFQVSLVESKSKTHLCGLELLRLQDVKKCKEPKKLGPSS
jgi:hypothetical protein